MKVGSGRRLSQKRIGLVALEERRSVPNLWMDGTFNELGDE